MKRLHTDSLKIGTYINDRLQNYLPCFPIIAEKGANYPFCVYRRTALSGNTSKDGYTYEETISVEIVVCATTYSESIRYAHEIKTQLEQQRGRFENINITNISLTNANEDWSGDAYIQRLYFNIDIDNN